MRLIYRSRDAMKMFTEMGVSARETPYEVAQDSQVVITMLPSSSHVSCVAFLGRVLTIFYDQTAFIWR